MDNSLIQKKLVHAGKVKADVIDGAKVLFHIKVETVEDEKLIDDSRSWLNPIELILGKKFKLEVWEGCIRTMGVNEVSCFTVDKSLLSAYPVVSKTLRDHDAKKKGKIKEMPSQHCCGLAMNEGLGYPDLNELTKNPKDLKFTIELLKCEASGMYNKEFWAMTEAEQLSSIPILKEEGNLLYNDGNYIEAAAKYYEAIGRLDNIMLKEKPGEEEWKCLNSQKMVLLLNYSQCQHLLGEYYSAIEHCSSVLDHDKDNVKALFRRGRAYVEVYSPTEARNDLQRAMELDKSSAASCKKFLNQLTQIEREKAQEDKQIYKKLFS